MLLAASTAPGKGQRASLFACADGNLAYYAIILMRAALRTLGEKCHLKINLQQDVSACDAGGAACINAYEYCMYS